MIIDLERDLCAAADQLRAALYGPEHDPHADAYMIFSGDQLALAARALVRAVDALDRDLQPVDWDEVDA